MVYSKSDTVNAFQRKNYLVLGNYNFRRRAMTAIMSPWFSLSVKIRPSATSSGGNGANTELPPWRVMSLSADVIRLPLQYFWTMPQ